MAPPKKKSTNPGTSNTEGLDLHDAVVQQTTTTEPTLAQLAEQEKREKAQHAIQAKKAAAAAAQGDPEESDKENLE